MTIEQAYEQFEKWYELCLNFGIQPELIVAKMGGMALVTDENIVNKLQDEGLIPTYD
jgi:type IV secretory pathway VirB6-like protein